MDQCISVGVRKLKNNLSAYLREVKKGSLVLVTEHGRVIAEIKVSEGEYDFLKIETIKQEWVDSGKLHLPLEKKGTVKESPVTLPMGTAKRMIDLDRGRY